MKFKSSRKTGGLVVELGPRETQLPTVPGELTPKKILVPVDFSGSSRKAAAYAAAFARQFGAQVLLMHVLETYLPVSEPYGPDVALIMARAREAAAVEMEKLRTSVNLSPPPQTLLCSGNPHVEIVRTAQKIGADLIVIATHGRTGLPHLFMGSVAENVIRHAGCPVLVVRENEREFLAAASVQRAAVLAPKTRRGIN
jgi:universal stress protein A